MQAREGWPRAAPKLRSSFPSGLWGAAAHGPPHSCLEDPAQPLSESGPRTVAGTAGQPSAALV